MTQAIRAQVKQQAINVQIINITLGRTQPNPNVLEQMNLTAAQQRVETLKEATQAEEQRKLEQEVVVADNAYRNQMGLSPPQYLLRQVAEINAQACVQATACYIVPSGTAIVAQPSTTAHGAVDAGPGRSGFKRLRQPPACQRPPALAHEPGSDSSAVRW